ncbi:hypothetical protein D3C80_1487060 [compost metagenome]
MVRLMAQTKKAIARIDVARVSRLPAPRAVMKPEGPPPMPRAPPSERCSRITAVRATEIRIMATSKMVWSMVSIMWARRCADQAAASNTDAGPGQTPNELWREILA